MFTIHYLLPFIVLGIIVAHLQCLHYMGSGSASTIPGGTVDAEPFILYYYKDEEYPSAVTGGYPLLSWGLPLG